MGDYTNNSKRLAKNTLFLYLRMFLIMAISIYTSRVVLYSLGVNDYGIYNVVGGFVSLFSVVNASMVSAIVRFITVAQGNENIDESRKVFCTSVNIEIIIGSIVLILAETIGLWFVNNKLVIPEERLFAANVVYQLSVLSFLAGLINIPYNASIVAHEKMSAFAFISIFEALWKLFVAYVICYTQYDKLIVYAVLLCCISIMLIFTYGIYCRWRFQECKYGFYFDKEILTKMLKFAGWETIGSSASVIRDQGLNILLNLFFGPVVNAARGVSMQVYTAIINFVNNFCMALNPQIIKAYTQNNMDYLMKLVFKGARFSYYLMFFLSLPVLVNTHYLLNLWLDSVPEHTVAFVRLILITGLISTLSETLCTTQNATGNNKWYQIIIGGTNLLTIPVAYLALILGAPSESVFVVTILIEVIRLFLRLPILNRMVDINILAFVKEVILYPFIISVEASIIPVCLKSYLNESFATFFFVSLLCVVCVSLFVYVQGLSDEERFYLLKIVKKYVTKH